MACSIAASSNEDIQELAHVMRSLGQNPTEAEVEDAHGLDDVWLQQFGIAPLRFLG